MIDLGNGALRQRVPRWGCIPFEEGLHNSTRHWRPADEQATEGLRLSSLEAMFFAQDLADRDIDPKKLGHYKVAQVFCRAVCNELLKPMAWGVFVVAWVGWPIALFGALVWWDWDDTWRERKAELTNVGLTKKVGLTIYGGVIGLVVGESCLSCVCVKLSKAINRIKEAVNIARGRQNAQVQLEACLQAEEEQQLIDGVDDDLPRELECPGKMHILSDPVYITHHSELYSSGFVWTGIAKAVNHPIMTDEQLTNKSVIPFRRLSKKRKQHLAEIKQASQEWRARTSQPGSTIPFHAAG
ncbi:hypothetical protein [Parendozoicomonas haliclonae]|uniref:Uncharacterized protein n=1 Tax=Parendozoicomonas haliclonae TaxID=1960125 RepID=A0A1X7AN62_9GAMM|nr:hypothetical protein [Parendozoicomonas haliclonae]SMA49734.1 hypothetical protein EHSB41UT_03516 [Parendozoicomonas haliclonae]